MYLTDCPGSRAGEHHNTCADLAYRIQTHVGAPLCLRAVRRSQHPRAAWSGRYSIHLAIDRSWLRHSLTATPPSIIIVCWQEST